MMTKRPHIPVLLKEVLKNLKCSESGVYIDGTFGAGGYTRAVLEANRENKVIAFDRDPFVLPAVEAFKREFGTRFSFVQDCFSQMPLHVTERVNGLVLDLGVSSMQIDQSSRGFSFRADGPLDMRMGQEGISAREVVNMYDENQLADIFYQYGEERASRRIARAIVKERLHRPILSTLQLAEIIHQVMPKPKDGSDSAMRTFQALRIFVNNELKELEAALEASKILLAPAGRLVVVSFHSLEDRIVKNFLIQNSALRPNENRHTAFKPILQKNVFEVVTKRPITPTPEELQSNSRSHSAKLRCGIRLGDA